MSHVATEPCAPTNQPVRQPLADDQRDAWLDDVRRWYYGGMEPLGDVDAGASRTNPDGRDNQPAAR